jgi:tripartite-type tricarboxylate transporter receptor subunit TctC
VFEQVSTQIGQAIIIENRPGGGGTTCSSIVAKADADGYTTLANSSARTNAPSVALSIPLLLTFPLILLFELMIICSPT